MFNMTLYPKSCSGEPAREEINEIICTWEIDNEDEGFVTSCGHWHDINAGYPDDIIFCPYCLAKIHVEDKE